MDLLVLGGTKFAGRAVVDAALGRGDRVTLFNRGLTGPGLYPGLETIIGDRAGDLAPLTGRRWDAVVDVAAYDPEVVRRSVDVLAGQVSRYVFVSTVSVYEDHRGRQREDSPVIALNQDTPEEDLYGARKAAAERIVTGGFGDRALIARPGLIVGPHDPTDRFAYWPRRIARGGQVLAPGDPADLVQFIDVRDLAGWITDGCHRGLGGVFNLTGEPMAFGHLLARCIAVTSSDADLAWVAGDRLLAAGVDPWMGIPLWIGAPGWEGANDVDVTRVLAAGLCCATWYPASQRLPRRDPEPISPAQPFLAGAPLNPRPGHPATPTTPVTPRATSPAAEARDSGTTSRRAPLIGIVRSKSRGAIAALMASIARSSVNDSTLPHPACRAMGPASSKGHSAPQN